MPERRFFVLFNPASGRGRGSRRKARYLDLLGDALGDFEHASSEKPGDLETLTRQALADGFDNIVAIGGDGTWSLVANEILHHGDPRVALGILPAGTGSDFGKSLGVVYRKVEQAVRALAESEPGLVDVGRVGDRHFVNIFGCGFDVAVVDDASSFKRLKGNLVYQFCALRQLFRYRGRNIAVRADDVLVNEGPCLMLAIANGRYFGGSFDIAPLSSLRDGKLDVVAIGDTTGPDRLRLFARVARGRHQHGEGLSMVQASTIELEFDAPLRYELDGEIYQCDENRLRIDILPSALRLYTVTRQAG